MSKDGVIKSRKGTGTVLFSDSSLLEKVGFYLATLNYRIRKKSETNET
jgi:hypothetical protein